jgi:hypothetical protein
VSSSQRRRARDRSFRCHEETLQNERIRRKPEGRNTYNNTTVILSSLLQVSGGVSALVRLLLDEISWDHVHHGDLKWILPVPGVKDEVGRANDAAKGWYSNPAGLPCGFDSKEFPFNRFISECVRSNSMRIHRRLWKIYK